MPGNLTLVMSNSGSGNAYAYDWTNRAFEDFPYPYQSLVEEMACGTATKANGRTIVVVAGGFYRSYINTKNSPYQVQKTWSWYQLS